MASTLHLVRLVYTTVQDLGDADAKDREAPRAMEREDFRGWHVYNRQQAERELSSLNLRLASILQPELLQLPQQSVFWTRAFWKF